LPAFCAKIALREHGQYGDRVWLFANAVMPLHGAFQGLNGTVQGLDTAKEGLDGGREGLNGTVEGLDGAKEGLNATAEGLNGVHKASKRALAERQCRRSSGVCLLYAIPLRWSPA
jgi:hypothetical protein